MRLDKYIADVSSYSRNDVKNLVRAKRITVNEQIVKTASLQISATDIVKLDDEVIEYVEYEYYLLNKPAGYLSATYDDYDPIIMDLIISKRSDLAPVGRLDKDSEGVILITNDGMLNHQLLAKNNHVDKKYYVEVDSDIPDNAEELFKMPMEFKEFTSLPAKYEAIDKRKAYLTIQEGKFHQVKRMFEKIGCHVTYLKRVCFGPLELGDLKTGEYRALTVAEIESLKSY